MAHFIGYVTGARGTESRLGHKSSGVTVKAASWLGAVETYLYHDEKTGRDMARVSLVTHQGAGVERLLYDGPVNEAAAESNMLTRAAVKRATKKTGFKANAALVEAANNAKALNEESE